MRRKRSCGRLDTRNRVLLIKRVILDDMHHGDMCNAYIILRIDLYSWVGEEEGYDGCVAIQSRAMQRGPANL